MVGMPRRSDEWSTESSWTTLARWMSSTMAAMVSARSWGVSSSIDASSSTVGRNILPFMPVRCAFTDSTIGASARTMRHISSGTHSRRARTGAWISSSAEASRMGLVGARSSREGGLHGVQSLADVTELDVDGEDPFVERHGFGRLLEALRRVTHQVEHANELVVAGAGFREGTLQDGPRDGELPLLEEALAERLVRAHAPLRAAQGLLELGDGLVEETHLLVGDAEVVVRLVVLFLDIVGHALLELAQHVLEVGVLVATGLLLVDHHAGRLRLLVLAKPVTQRHKVVLARGVRRGGHRDGFFGNGGNHAGVAAPRCGRTVDRHRRGRCLRSGRGERFERGEGAHVVGRDLQDTLIHRLRFLGEPFAEERVGEVQVRLRQAHAIVVTERELDTLLVMAHRGGVQANDLVGNGARLMNPPRPLEPHHRLLEHREPFLAT